MSFTEIIKRNTTLRKIGKQIKIMYAYYHDIVDFSKYYMEKAELEGDYRYRIMHIVHSIEKGMCMPSPRPYGFDKVSKLLRMLEEYNSHESYEYRMGVSALYAWKDFLEKNNWCESDTWEKVGAFLQRVQIDKLPVGNVVYEKPMIDTDSPFSYVLESRKAVRDFADKAIEEHDLEFAIKCFIETPTACNRQMCNLYMVRDENIKKCLDNVIIGLPGFNKSSTNFFIITYDLASLDYSGERNQGHFNAGLCTMNFVNGLHASGIGSCCLQWSNQYNEDAKVRSLLGLSKSERIAVVIGAGYYLPESTVPISNRKSKADVFRVL